MTRVRWCIRCCCLRCSAGIRKCSPELSNVGCRYWNHVARVECAIAPNSFDSQSDKGAYVAIRLG